MLHTFQANSGSYDRTALFREGTSFRSMAEALPMVKKMVTNLVESGSKVPTWVLTNFNDPDVELEINTTDVKELRSSMNDLKYDGGGDFSEQVLKGKKRFSAI